MSPATPVLFSCMEFDQFVSLRRRTSNVCSRRETRKQFKSLKVGMQDHVVWIPNCRRKVLFGQLRKHLGEVFHDLARQKESKILVGHLQSDHVYVLISIPPKYSVAQVVGYIKGKSAIHIARTYLGQKKNYGGYLLLRANWLELSAAQRLRSTGCHPDPVDLYIFALDRPVVSDGRPAKAHGIPHGVIGRYAEFPDKIGQDTGQGQVDKPVPQGADIHALGIELKVTERNKTVRHRGWSAGR